MMVLRCKLDDGVLVLRLSADILSTINLMVIRTRVGICMIRIHIDATPSCARTPTPDHLSASASAPHTP